MEDQQQPDTQRQPQQPGDISAAVLPIPPVAVPPAMPFAFPGQDAQAYAAAAAFPGFFPPVAGAMPGLGFPMGMNPMVQLPIPVINDPAILAQLTGFDEKVVRDNPTMLAAAQQFLAQRLLQQQFMAAAGGMAHPAAGVNLQAAMRQHQQMVAGGGTKTHKSAGKGRGGGGKALKPAPYIPGAPISKENPGGRVIWAKLSSSPWWPAKTLDPARDVSYPTEVDPPRPTAIPVRFFGTHEFGWLGSKRALTEWKDGIAKFSLDCDQDSFKQAIAEAEAYLQNGTLPEMFFVPPEAEGARKTAAKAQPRKRSSGVAAPRVKTEDGGGMAGFVMPGMGGSGGAAPRTKAAKAAASVPEEDRATVVYARKKQRLAELGLLPPEESPFAAGQVAPNPELLAKAAEWEAAQPDVMAAARATAVAEAELPPRASVPPPPPLPLMHPMQPVHFAQQMGVPDFGALPLGMDAFALQQLGTGNFLLSGLA